MIKQLVCVLLAVNGVLLASENSTQGLAVREQKTCIQIYTLSSAKKDLPAIIPSSIPSVSLLEAPKPESSATNSACFTCPHHNDSDDQDEPSGWCEHHDRTELCDICAPSSYNYGYGRGGNDSE